MSDSNNLKEDITKLKTVGNYARFLAVDRQTVYNMIKDGRVKAVIIDGMRFIKLKRGENFKSFK